MAANVLGRAYIEIHADTKAFAKELNADTQAIAAFVERQAEGAGESIGHGLNRGIQRATVRGSARVAGTLYRAIGRNLTRVGQGQNLLGAITPNLVSHAAAAGARAGTSAAANFANLFLQGIQNVGRIAGGIVTSIGSSVGNVGAAGPLAPIIGGLIILGIPALIGAIIAVVSALAGLLNILFLIPGAIAGVLAAIFPLVVAFQGFGEAIEAVLSGDPKKITAALKELAPAARSVVRDIAKMVPFFREMQRFVQQSFFAQLIGDLPKLQKALGPLFRAGFAQVAAAAGRFADALIKLASDPVVIRFFSDLFKFTADAFAAAEPSVINFLKMLAVLGSATFPVLLALIQGFGRLVDRFAAWITEAIESGEFDVFMLKLQKALENLSDIAGASWNFITALIGDEGQQGKAQEFFDDLVETINVLADFFKSEAGEEAIKGMIDLARIFLLVVVAVVVAFGNMLAFIEQIIKGIKWIIDHTIGEEDVSSLRPVGSPIQSLGAPGHAQGGIFNTEHLARIAEQNRPEVVIPLTDPGRARELAHRSGLMTMMGGGDTQVIVYIGDEQVMARVERRVSQGLRQFGRDMKYGPRPVGVGG